MASTATRNSHSGVGSAGEVGFEATLINLELLLLSSSGSSDRGRSWKASPFSSSFPTFRLRTADRLPIRMKLTRPEWNQHPVAAESLPTCDSLFRDASAIVEVQEQNQPPVKKGKYDLS